MSRAAAEELIAHAAWMRRLARALAGGEADADDLVQEACVAALRSPPDPGRPARPWLAQVVRNAWRMRQRGEARRGAREAEVARAGEAGAAAEAPDPGALLDRAMAQRALAEAVVQLDEPLRRTLLLRHFEGLPAPRIAELEGVAAATIRWRLAEALERLRRAMDESAGPRGRWLKALAPGGLALPGPEAATVGSASASASASATASGAAAATTTGESAAGATIKGVLLMKTKTKVAAAVIAILALGGGAAVMLGGGGEDRGRRGEEQAAAGGEAPGGGPAPARRMTGGAPGEPPAALDARPLALVTAEAELDPSAPQGAIEGRVVNWGNGEPVAGAEVSLALDDGAATTVTTGADGGFRFAPARAGRVTLASITASGYLPFAPEWGHSPIELWARPGVRVRDVVVYLTPAIDYTGVVLSAAGEPVAGAEVRLIDLPAGEQEIVSIRDRYRTDARGEFSFHAPDFALLEARASGHGTGRARLDGGAQTSHRLTIRLGPAAAEERLGSAQLAGVVVDAAGEPVSGALVRAEPLRRPPPALPIDPDLVAAARAVTGEDGRFALAGLDPATYRVEARTGEHAPARAEVTLAAGAREEVRLALSAGAVLAGQVTGAGGEPVPAFTVVVSRAEGLAAHLAAVRTVVDREGRFAIDGLAPGDYQVQATAHGHAPSGRVSGEAAVPPARPAPITLVLPAGGTLTGHVRTSGGAPLENARVSVEGGLGEATSPVPFAASAVTGADGAFVLRGLAPGRRSVVVGAYDHHPTIIGGLVVEEGASLGPLEIELTPVAEGEEPTIELAGIGAKLSVDGDAMLVEAAIPGGGAEAAGIAPGDRILSVDGAPVTTLGFDGAIQAIRGPVGTTVRLGVQKAGAGGRTDLTVERRKIRS